MNKEQLAAKGRNGDTHLAHLQTGEMIVPPVITPELRAEIMAQMEAAGIPSDQYTVGEGMSINPETGLPEFGFGKIFKKIVGIAAPLALSYFAPGLGSAIGGSLLGAGAAGASTLGGALLGGGIGLATGGGLKGAALGALGGGIAPNIGDIGSALNNATSGALTDFGNYTGLGDLYNSASGALGKVGSGVDSLYQGSDLQSAFKSGGDALKSIGIGTGSENLAAAPVSGGGASSYGSGLSKASFDSTFAPSEFYNGFDSSAPFSAAGFNESFSPDKFYNEFDAGGTVAKSNYSPLASALLGTNSNNQAEKALLAGQKANQALLAPYANGFSFTPGDLQNDPGYQFQLQQGTQAADRAQLARGGYFSGEALKDAQQFGTGLADSTYNAAYNRALQGNQAGLTGALANAGVNTDIGNIKANSATNQGNLYSGALGSYLGGNSFTNSGALQGGFDIQDFLRRNRIGASSYV